jgi:transcriptional regulator with XRE-family HTH domain
MSVSYLNDIEHDRHTPSLGRLAAVASAMGLAVTELLAGTPYDDKPNVGNAKSR